MTFLILSNATLMVENVDGTNGFAEISLEDAKITVNYSTILHIINPLEIIKVTETLEHYIEQIRDNEENHFLIQEFNKVKSKLVTINLHRQRIGLINIIGSGMKWLYGTMDDSDREEIEQHLQTMDENSHAIIENSNQNIEINNVFNVTIAKLKEAIDADREKFTRKFNEITASDYNNES